MDTAKTEAPPRYIGIVNELRDQIVSGALQPGERLPSYSQARSRYGVHSNTMDRVLIQLEREGLIDRRRGSGVFVSARPEAPGVAAGACKSLTFGLGGSGFSYGEFSPYWGQLLRGIRERAEAEEIGILLLPENSRLGWDEVDGILLSDWEPWHMYNALVPESMPCVGLLSALPNRSRIMADDYSGGRAATEHLLSLGHRRIGYLFNDDKGVIPLRIQGYRDAMHAARLDPPADWARLIPNAASSQTDFRFTNYGSDFVEAGRSVMRDWLREGWCELGCTAILANNDEVAIGMIEALSEAGLRVPDDVSIVGFDDTLVGQYFKPSLTTFQVPLRRMGNLALEVLLRQVRDEVQVQEHHVLPMQLQARESTSAPSSIAVTGGVAATA